MRARASSRHLLEVFLSRLRLLGVIDERSEELVRPILARGLMGMHKVAALERTLGRSRRLILRDMKKAGLSGPNHWLMAAKLMYVLCAFWRAGDGLMALCRNLGYDGFVISTLCIHVTGVRPCVVRERCEVANSMFPIIDACVPYLIASSEEVAA